MSFDYHLSSKEQQKIERIVPLHQAKIHIAFKCNFTLNEKKYSMGACALSEHMIVLCKKTLVGGSLSHVKTIHILDIENFSTSSDSQCKVTTRNDSFQLQSKACLRFARILVRNYYVITTMFPPNMRFQFRPHDPNLFPPFNPKMSPSQMFQFSYNANCSYYNTSYEHDVSRFFHQMVISGNGIADLNQLPLALMEVNLGDPLELRPLFAAMMFCPVIYGVVCHGIARPDIVRAIAPLVIANSNMNIVDLHDCRVETGITELSDAILNNKNCQVRYWDLSDNPFQDVSPFCAALGRTKANVFYLNLGNTGLSADGTKLLFQAMRSNKHLWNIRHLNIRGADVTDQAIEFFGEHLRTLSSSDMKVLKSLNIGNTGGSIEKMLKVLNSNPQPIENLDISGGTIKSKAFNELMIFIEKSETLKSLNISDTGLKVDQVKQIIAQIAKNEHITAMNLNLSSLGLSGKKLGEITSVFEKHSLMKWSGLGFECNGMGEKELNALFGVVKRMINLRELAIGGNIDKSDKGGIKSIRQILSMQSLETLSIRGYKKKLGSGAVPILQALINNTTLRALDISNNNIGDDGINVICDIIEKNHTLNDIQLDGNKMKDSITFGRLLDILSDGRTTMTSCEFPMDDCYDLIQGTSSSKKKALFELFSDKQKRAQEAMQRNQCSVGIHSDLSKKGIEELDDLLDDVTMAVHERLEGIKIHQHAALASAFGLPMPHLDEDDDQTRGSVASGNPKEGEEYGLDNANVTIVEETVEEADGLATLQFNSLCIRRPGAAQEAARRRSSIDMSGMISPDLHDQDFAPSHMPSPLAGQGYDDF